jgi:hypothetical protein
MLQQSEAKILYSACHSTTMSAAILSFHRLKGGKAFGQGIIQQQRR